MSRYRKKPVVIEAELLTRRNGEALAEWCGGEAFDISMMPGFCHHIDISTLEGTMRATPGDYIIKGTQGEFYPCKPQIFEDTYELADGLSEET